MSERPTSLIHDRSALLNLLRVTTIGIGLAVAIKGEIDFESSKTLIMAANQLSAAGRLTMSLEAAQQLQAYATTAQAELIAGVACTLRGMWTIIQNPIRSSTGRKK